LKSIVGRVLFVVCGLLLAATTFAADKTRPNFSGTWQLNEELSDDIREKIGEAIRARMRGGGMGGRGGPGGPPDGGGRMGQARERMKQMQEGMQRLTIAQTESELTVTNAIDREQRFFTDGRKQTREGGFGPVEFEATWKKRSLVVIEKPEAEGATVTRTYFFRRDDPHLYVNVKVEGRGPVFDYQRVYDRTPQEEPQHD
jgi:hypothetical protein